MSRRDLTGHDQLDAAEQGLGRAWSAVEARIQEHKHAPLRFLGRDASPSLQNARPHVGPLPVVRYDLGIRLGGEGVAEHEPEWLQPELSKLTKIQPAGVLAAWSFAFFDSGGGLDGHRMCPPV